MGNVIEFKKKSISNINTEGGNEFKRYILGKLNRISNAPELTQQTIYTIQELTLLIEFNMEDK